MGSFNFHNNNIKVEKANAIRRYRGLQKISAMFRFIELSVFFIILTRFSTQLPSVFKDVPTEFFQGLSVTLISPRFVFVLGNVIFVVLLMQSGHFAAKDGHKDSNKIDFYDEYMKNCRKNQQKQQISEGRKVSSISRERKIKRSHSEKMERLHQEEPRRHEFRRSVTETCRKSVNHSHNPNHQTRKLVLESKKQMDDHASYAEDEMSSEEFRSTVEAFIARQQRILREQEIPTVFPVKND